MQTSCIHIITVILIVLVGFAACSHSQNCEIICFKSCVMGAGCYNECRCVVRATAAPPAPLISAVLKLAASTADASSYLTSKIIFTNQHSQNICVAKYKITWPGGTATFMPKKLCIPPGVQERIIQIKDEAVDLIALRKKPNKARVEILEFQRSSH
jgi:hypothetical protein